MNRLRVLSLMTLMMMLASRLPGQTPAQGEDWGGQVVACNDGKITFSVARAYRDLNFLSGYQWKFEGWYNVDPGKCQDIGASEQYQNGGPFRKDSVALLAFTFYDSTGTWGAIRPEPFGDDRQWHLSNQQFCVRRDGFGYDRDSPGGDLPQACDGAQAGYQMIPASYEYTGPLGLPRLGFASRNEFHVNIAPSARAIPLGKQTSNGGAAQGTGTINDLSEVLGVIFRGPGAPKLRAPNLKGWLEVCAPSTVVKSQSWANPPSPRTEALKEAIRRFISTHTFDGTHPKIRVTDPQGKFTVQEVTACPGDYYVEVNGPD